MPQLRFNAQARFDLDDIWRYIAGRSIERADGFIDRIEEKCRLLAENPMLGRSREELAPSLRSFPVGNYLLFYVPLEDGVEVVRVLSGARDLPSAF